MKLPDCRFRHLVNGQSGPFRCLHPQMFVPDGQVTAELCRVCNLRNTADAPRLPGASPCRVRGGRRLRTVAVIIPCHNYGRYLAAAIESVLAQTRPADEILVVDDASSDETAEVARSFADRDVAYLRVEERHSQRTRRAGWLATQGEAICFLDADDELAPDYLECGMAEFDDVRVGIVYSDCEFFGLRRGVSAYPEHFDRGRLARMNYLHTGCLVRREALDISRAFDALNDDQVSLQDWLLWRRVADYGWQARKQKSLYRYRQHPRSMTAAWQAANYDYFARASLALETVTLFIPLSGRERLWPAMADFLDRQTWPHEQTRLILFDTSQSDAFSRRVRRWLADCDYRDVRHWREAVGEPGLADEPRLQSAEQVTLAMTRIYNRLAREAASDYVWIVEDDIVPPRDACRSLLEAFDGKTASVSGVYRSRFGGHYVAWGQNGQFTQREDGIEQVAGNGFGCVVLRGDVLRETVFTATIDRPAYDAAFYFRLAKTGLKAKVDWSVECQHLTGDATPTRSASEERVGVGGRRWR